MVYIHSPPRSPAREEEIEEGHEMQKTNEFEDGYSLPTSALTEVISMSSDASGNASIMKDLDENKLVPTSKFQSDDHLMFSPSPALDLQPLLSPSAQMAEVPAHDDQQSSLLALL